jgi:hypothetical protein
MTSSMPSPVTSASSSTIIPYSATAVLDHKRAPLVPSRQRMAPPPSVQSTARASSTPSPVTSESTPQA